MTPEKKALHETCVCEHCPCLTISPQNCGCYKRSTQPCGACGPLHAAIDALPEPAPIPTDAEAERALNSLSSFTGSLWLDSSDAIAECGNALATLRRKLEGRVIEPAGPYPNCLYCDTPMVWDSARCRTWMCPCCVYDRMLAAEKQVKLLAAPEPPAMPEEVEACALVFYRMHMGPDCDTEEELMDCWRTDGCRPHYLEFASRVLADKKVTVEEANRKADAHYEAKMEGLRAFAEAATRTAVEAAVRTWKEAAESIADARDEYMRDCARAWEAQRKDANRADRLESDRAERIAKVEEAAATVRIMESELPPFPGRSALYHGIEAIVAAAKGEKA